MRRVKRLFRYRSVTDDRFDRELHAIRHETIWCSDYRSFNDPMEGYYWAMSSPDKIPFPIALNRLRMNKRLFGLASFTETHDNELMWAHYAGNYSGICIEYDFDKLEYSCEVGDVRLDPVVYSSRLLKLRKSDINDYKEAAFRILTHKKASWAYEREWRLLTSLGQHSLLPGSIRKIYLGARMSQEIQDRLVRKVGKHRPGIQFSKMRLRGYRHEWVDVS